MNKSVRSGVVAMVVAMIAVTTPAAAQVGAPAPSPNTPAAVGVTASPQVAAPDQSYVLGPDDVVEIEVLGRGDFRTRARVGSDGKIQVPFLGEVEAWNRTAKQLGEELARSLEAGGYFTRPVMKVEVVSFASRYAVVLGAVGNPGLVPINRAYRLSEIVARVGGIRGDGADYIVIRPENGAERRYNVTEMATGDASKDPFVAAGDKVFVPSAEVFYISGQVRASGSYPVSSSMTFRQAIARGGGLTEMGSDKRIKVTRDGKELNRVALDELVKAGDVVVIGERLF